MAFHPNPEHRRQAMRWAQDLMKRDFYALDTETTGLGKRDEIVQIAIVDQNGKKALNELIKPTIPIPSEASRIHGIYDRKVEYAVSFEAIHDRLSEILTDQVVIAYNMDFEWRMMQQSGAKYGLSDIQMDKKSGCVMKQYARYKGTAGRRREYKWHKLGNAIVQEGLEVLNAHDALDDARMTLALIRKMAEST